MEDSSVLQDSGRPLPRRIRVINDNWGFIVLEDSRVRVRVQGHSRRPRFKVFAGPNPSVRERKQPAPRSTHRPWVASARARVERQAACGVQLAHKAVAVMLPVAALGELVLLLACALLLSTARERASGLPNFVKLCA